MRKDLYNRTHDNIGWIENNHVYLNSGFTGFSGDVWEASSGNPIGYLGETGTFFPRSTGGGISAGPVLSNPLGLGETLIVAVGIVLSGGFLLALYGSFKLFQVGTGYLSNRRYLEALGLYILSLLCLGTIFFVILAVTLFGFGFGQIFAVASLPPLLLLSAIIMAVYLARGRKNEWYFLLWLFFGAFMWIMGIVGAIVLMGLYDQLT